MIQKRKDNLGKRIINNIFSLGEIEKTSKDNISTCPGRVSLIENGPGRQSCCTCILYKLLVCIFFPSSKSHICSYLFIYHKKIVFRVTVPPDADGWKECNTSYHWLLWNPKHGPAILVLTCGISRMEFCIETALLTIQQRWEKEMWKLTLIFLNVGNFSHTSIDKDRWVVQHSLGRTIERYMWDDFGVSSLTILSVHGVDLCICFFFSGLKG